MVRIGVLSLALALLVISNCSDKTTNPDKFTFSGITATDFMGSLTSFDPDDWCYGDIVLTDELVYLAPEVWIFAADSGATGSTGAYLFNYSDHDVTIQMVSNDTSISFPERSVTIYANSWGIVAINYTAYVRTPHFGELALPVEPDGDTLYLPFVGFSDFVTDPFPAPQNTFAPAIPNPTVGHTYLRFTLAEDAHVRLVVRGPDNYISDTQVLLDQNMPRGAHNVNWAGPADGEPGIYRAYLTIGDDFSCSGDIEVADVFIFY